MTKKIPEIRFAGFSGEWDKKRIGDGFDIVSGGTPDTSKTKYWSDEGINWFTPTEVNKRVLDTSIRKISQEGLSKSSAKILPKDKTVLYTSRATIGLSSLISQDSTTNQGFQSIVLKNDNYNIYFVYTLTHKITKKARKLAYGSTFLEISNKSMKSIIINFPDIEEQEKIGELFETLDACLEDQAAYVETLKKSKKAFLQKLFPQKGAKVPELRSPGFEGDWEEKKLRNIASFKKGKGYTKNDLSERGNKIYLYGNLYTNYKSRISRVITFTNKKITNPIISEGNEVLIPSSGETSIEIARASYMEEPGVILGGDLNIIKPIEEVSPHFLALDLSNGLNKIELAKRAQGKTVVHIGNKDIQELTVIMPKKQEQEKIGAFFKALDYKIEKEEDKLESFERLKRALLQKVFV